MMCASHARGHPQLPNAFGLFLQSGTRHIFMKQTQPPTVKPEGRHKYRASAAKAKAEVAYRSGRRSINAIDE